MITVSHWRSLPDLYAEYHQVDAGEDPQGNGEDAAVLVQRAVLFHENIFTDSVRY